MICKSHTHAQRDCPAATVMTLDDPVVNVQAASTSGRFEFVVAMALFSAFILPLCLLFKGTMGGVQHLLLGDRKTTMFAIVLFSMLMVIAVDAAPSDFTSTIASHASISKNLFFVNVLLQTSHFISLDYETKYCSCRNQSQRQRALKQNARNRLHP